MQQLLLLQRPERVTKKSSLTVLKQLMEVSVSCITYIRGLLPEENYELKEFSGTTLKVLRKNHCKENTKILNILELGVFDAIEKQYLRQMTFGIFADPKTPDTFLECYHFYLSYPLENKTSKVQIHNQEGDLITELDSMDNIKQQSLKMMRALVVLVQTLADLPDNCFLTFRLYYYDDITPKKYQPKYFADYDGEYTFPCAPKVKSTVGNIHTSFHNMGLEVVSVCDELEPTQSQPQPGKIPLDTEKKDEMKTNVGRSTTEKIEELLQRNKLAKRAVPASPVPQKEVPKKTVESKRGKRSAPLENAPDDKIQTRCVCEFTDEDCGMVLCEQCFHWSHVVCWGFYHEKDPRVLSRAFFCHVCHPVEDLQKRRILALFRTAIAVSWNEMRNQWDAETLAKRIDLPVSLCRTLILGMVQKGMAKYSTVQKRKCYKMLKETPEGKQAVKDFFNPDAVPELPDALEVKEEVPETQETMILESEGEDFKLDIKEQESPPKKDRIGVPKRKESMELRDSCTKKKPKISAIFDPIQVA